MKTSTRIVWLGYGSIVLALAWGVPGMALGWWAHRLRNQAIASQENMSGTERRDARGGILLAKIGMVLSGIVLAVVLWSWVSTLLTL